MTSFAEQYFKKLKESTMFTTLVKCEIHTVLLHLINIETIVMVKYQSSVHSLLSLTIRRKFEEGNI